MINYFIPQQIEAAFKSKKDSSTGRQGYLTFIDRKGKLRSKGSWIGWGDLPNETIDNQPTSGFILEGYLTRGQRNYLSYWVRLSDPRGFDIEISLDNFMYILNFEGLIKSTKEITGEFVYGWKEERQLWLLPCNSDRYKNSLIESKKLCSEKISKKSLIPGAKYLTNSEREIIYIGDFKLMKNYGKGYETLPLFIKDSKDILYTEDVKNIKYLIEKDSVDHKIVEEISEIFEKTAYSKTFWDNVASEKIIQGFIPITDRKYDKIVKPDTWINPNNDAKLEIGIVEDDGKTLKIGKPVFVLDKVGHKYSVCLLKLKCNIPCIEFKNNSIKILDKFGSRKGKEIYSYSGNIADIYPNCTDTKITPTEYTCIPGYITLDGYVSDSLFYIARCDSFDKVSRLGMFKL